MATFQDKISRSSALYPATATVRNFIGSSAMYETRYVELQSGGRYFISVTLFRREGRYTKRLFCVEANGVKNKSIEKCYYDLAMFMDNSKIQLKNDFVTQGDEDIMTVTEPVVTSKTENVIIEGAQDQASDGMIEPREYNLLDWCNTEKAYDFTEGSAAIMNRWFPLDTVNVTTSDSYSKNGGLLKNWIMPQDLLKKDLDSINTLPIRGFLYGRYKMQFKLVLQANPFQACCLMLSVCPYSYGLFPKVASIKGFKINNSDVDAKQFVTVYDREFTYMDYQVACQRPNVIIDVTTGGEATVDLVHKFHRSFVRNFDFSMVSSVNPGIKGSNFGSVSLHVLSDLKVGSANEKNFNVKVYYRFVESSLAAMTKVVNLGAGSLKTLYPLNPSKVEDAKVMLNVDAKSRPARVNTVKSWYVQGPVMSIIGGVKTALDIADVSVKAIETIGNKSRKGFQARNRDKPNDTVNIVKVVPRNRNNFPNCNGIDDALVLAVGWNEMVNFFEQFTDEPKSFKDLFSIMGYHSRFDWSSVKQSGSVLYTWNIHPVLSDSMDMSALSGNPLRSPLSISSSCFTNYCGTMEILFQVIKTEYHRGSLEVAVHFGREIDSAGFHNSYVKILNIQETTGFKMTIPYIYDTPVRLISGTDSPQTIPAIYSEDYYAFAHSAKIQVSVVNELVAPTTVSNSIEILVWIKGGSDYSLMFPRSMNSVTTVVSHNADLINNPNNVRQYMKEPVKTDRYYYGENGVISKFGTPIDFQVQGEDFDSGPFVDNRITSQSHLDFHDLMKMPIKIISNLEVKKLRKVTFKDTLNGIEQSYDIQNYLNIPVTCLNSTLIWYLNKVLNNVGIDTFIPIGAMQSIQVQIAMMFGMFRGSVVLTVLLKKGKSACVRYIPHDYRLRAIQSGINSDFQLIQYSGDKSRFTGLPSFYPGIGYNQNFDVSMSSPYCVFMNATINPSEKFVIPHSSQNNWILLNRQPSMATTASGISTMRENSEWFNGHLCVWTTDEDVEVDVFISCGDDFEFGSFLGHPGICNPYSQFAIKDDWRIQGLDFNLKELTQNGWSSLKNTFVEVGFGAALGSMAPRMSNSGVAAVSGMVAGALVMKAYTDCNRAIDSGNTCISRIENCLENVVDNGAEVIATMIQKYFPYLEGISTIKNSLWTISQNLIHALTAQNYKNGAFALFCILMETKLFTMDDWKQLKDVLIDYVSVIMPGIFKAQGYETWESLMEILITIITAKFQIQSSGGVKWYLRQIFKWGDFGNVRGISSILNLMKTLFRAVTKLIDWCFEQKDPNITLLKSLRLQDKELLEFMEDANLYLNTMNDNDLKRKDNRVRFLHVILRAFKLRMVLIKIANPQLTSQLLHVCNKVVEKANSQRYLFKCDLVKSEPFVICIEGESGIGKSFCVYEMVSRLLGAINYKATNPDMIFTIPAGVQYWNGYMDQPAIWYDDWCNLTDEETMRMHISQLYALKTSAPFNVPRAELENKEQIANPELVFLTTNVPFPEHPIIIQQKAVYRRRDVVARFSLAEGVNMENMTTESKHRFEHLEIRFYSDVTDKTSLNNKVYTFNQFIERVSRELVIHHRKELENKEFKYNCLMKNVKKMKVDNLNLSNPFELIENCCLDDENLLTSEIVEQEVERLIQMINDHVSLSSSLSEDSDIFETQGLGRIKELVVTYSEKAWLSAKKAFSNVGWFFRTNLYMCESCHCHSTVHGVTYWCNEGMHYLCHVCSMFGKSKVTPLVQSDGLVDRTAPGVQTRTCCMHHSELEIVVEDIFGVIIAKLLTEKLTTPIRFMKMFATLTDKHIQMDSKIMYFVVSMMQMYIGISIESTIKLLKNYLKPQGWLDNDAINSMKTGVNFYLKEERWIPDTKLKEHFKNDEVGLKIKYVCPHSLLFQPYTYSNGKYYIVYSEHMVEVPDKICEGKCVLTNKTALEMVKLNFQVATEYVDAYFKRDVKIIQHYFPRFLWPVDILHKLDWREKLKKILNDNWWNYYVSPVGEWFMKCAKFIAPLLVACAAFWGACKASKYMWEYLGKVFLNNDLKPETEFDHDGGGHKREPRKTKKDKGRNRVLYTTQSYSENYENKLNKIAGNYILIGNGNYWCVAWGLKGSSFLIPNHLVIKLKLMRSVTIKFVLREHESYIVDGQDIEYMEIQGKDLALCSIKNFKLIFRDCSKFIPDKVRFDRDSGVALIMDVDIKQQNVTDVDIKLLSIVKNTQATSSTNVFSNDLGIMYNYQRNGMCGSLVCVDDDFPILAMHISGSNSLDKGIGVLLNRIDFQVQGVEMITDTGEDSIYYENTNIFYEATVEKDLIPFVPVKSSLKVSVIDKYFTNPSVMKPAFLSKKEVGYSHPYSPLYYGVCKNGKPNVAFPRRLVENSFKAWKPRMLSGSKIEGCRIMNVDEAVLGLNLEVEDPYSQAPYFGVLPLDTSAGWPYTTSKVKKEFGIKGNKKSNWMTYEFGEDGYPNKVVIHPYILDNHRKNMSERKLGKPSLNIFQDCLKDEKRPIEKMMREGGTRLFSMSNVEGSIALRRYALYLVSHLRKNRISNGFAVGINPESMEWTVLANVLRTKGDNIFTTDFSNFGAGLDYDCAMMFKELLKDYYKKMDINLDIEDKNIIDALIIELISSRHIAGNLVYRTQCGSPSGAAVTVEINGFVHLMYLAICWQIVDKIRHKLKGVGEWIYEDLDLDYSDLEEELKKTIDLRLSMTMEDFFVNVVCVVYGDDGICSVTDAYRDIFNSKIINLVLKEHRIGVTDATKSAEITPYLSLQQASFLKRKFQPCELMPSMIYSSVMDWNTVEECVRWVHCDKGLELEAIRENSISSLFLAWGHGSIKYNEWKDKINDYLEKEGIMPINITWEDIAIQYYPTLTVK